MARYIDADYLDKLITQLIKEGRNITRNDYKMIDSILFEFPTANVVERKSGKWIEYNYPGAECVYCSKCKEEYYPDDLLLGRNDYPNFCPNCGADMRKETEDAEES